MAEVFYYRFPECVAHAGYQRQREGAGQRRQWDIVINRAPALDLLPYRHYPLFPIHRDGLIELISKALLAIFVVNFFIASSYLFG